MDVSCPWTRPLGNGWNVVDGFYFAVMTLTTSSIADSDLVLDDRWIKVFTVFYVLVGIGVLVELGRRLALGFVAASKENRDDERTRRGERRTASGDGG